MDRLAVLQALSRVSRRDPSQILDHLSLGTVGVSSSLGLSLLRSDLEAQSGRTLGVIDIKMKVGDLIERLASSALERSAELAPRARQAAHGTGQIGLALVPGHFGLGLDIQEVASMPEAADYRAHSFYCDHFAPSEIATALLRAEPRVHLCGVFCAKEAAKKSHPALLEERMTSFIVSHDERGKPSLEFIGSGAAAAGLRFVVSISHTSSFAAAACITLSSWT